MSRVPRITAVALTTLSAVAAAGALTVPATASSPSWDEIVRQPLAAGDGWGSAGAGTTGGGSAATVTDVSTWDELRAALAAPASARIVVVHGTLRAFGFDDQGGGLPTCADFAAQAPVADGVPGHTFDMAEYRAAYDPSGPWGWSDPSGPLEDARVRAAAAQTAQVRLSVPSNTTLIGTDDAHIVGGQLLVQKASNVILRNLHVSDAYDCFPEWDPGDGATGNWNSLYDTVSVMTSTNVWVDRLTLDDGEHPPASLPHYFGRKFEVHDGLLDITHSSDLVTVSNTLLQDHDKTSLVGSSDSRVAQDTGLLRVTFHHNRWLDTGQRGPRVRFGDVDVYDSLYEITDPSAFEYLWGAGVDSGLVVQDVAVEAPVGFDPARLVRAYGGSALAADGVLLNGTPIDPVASYNANAAPGSRLTTTARWTPTLRAVTTPLAEVAANVRANAGSGMLEPRDESAPVVVPEGSDATATATATGTTALADSGSDATVTALGAAATGATALIGACCLVADRRRRRRKGTADEPGHAGSGW